jgi:hypothetical protein
MVNMDGKERDAVQNEIGKLIHFMVLGLGLALHRIA